MTKIISDQEEDLYGRAFAAGKAAGLMEQSVLVAHLRELVQRDSDRIIKLVSTINALREMAQREEELDGIKLLRMSKALDALVEAFALEKV